MKKDKTVQDRIRIVLVDSHTLLRQGLVALLSLEHDLEVVGQSHASSGLAQLLNLAQPQVIIVGSTESTVPLTDTVSHLRAVAPECAVLCLSHHTDVGSVRAMLEAGALGYASKLDSAEQLVDAVRSVAREERWLSPNLPAMDLESPPVLSPREVELVTLLASGASLKEVAKAMDVGLKTVETFRRRAARKLGARSAAQLVALAVRANICVRTQDGNLIPASSHPRIMASGTDLGRQRNEAAMVSAA